MAILNQRMAQDSTPDDPYVGAVAVDYSGGDQTLTTTARGVYVGGAGNLRVDLIDGSTVTFTALAVGNVYRFAVRKIYQTGSTATLCVALL